MHHWHVKWEPEFIEHHSATNRVAIIQLKLLGSGHVMRVETVTTVSAAVVGVLLLLASVGGAFGTQSTHDWPSSSGDWVIRLVLGEVVCWIVIIVVCNVIDVKCLRTATG